MIKPRIAVIGAGKFGEMHLRAFSQMQRDGRVELAAVADMNAELCAARARQYGTAGFGDHLRMLAEAAPHGVSVATPDYLHRQIALDCLRAGIHVLVEKPLDVTVEGCAEMGAAAAESGLLLQVDFHKRFDPYHRELERLVAAGSLGQVQYGYGYMEDRLEVPRDWFPQWAGCTSPAWFLGAHLYDLARWVIKSDALHVSATGWKGKLTGLGIDTYDSIQAKVVFRNGVSFCFDTSWILPDGHEAVVNQGFRVVGSEGMLEVDTQDRGARGCLPQPTDGRPQRGSGMQTPNLGFFTETREPGGRVRWGGYGIESIQSFAVNVEYLLNGGRVEELAGSYPDAGDGLQVTRIASAVHRSVEQAGALVTP
jgi:predicted dehydrogenase